MKKLFTIALLSVGLTLPLSSCKSDYEKYQEMMSEASNSPVTELVTPDSLSFNMDEDEYNSYIENIPHKEIDYNTYWLFHIEDEVYAASFSKSSKLRAKIDVSS